MKMRELVVVVLMVVGVMRAQKQTQVPFGDDKQERQRQVQRQRQPQIPFGDDKQKSDTWQGKWIGAPWSTVRDGAEVDGSRPMPVFRREFMVRGKVAQAELRIAGLGQFAATVNGKVVGGAGLHGAWTDYRKTVIYESYDVISLIRAGKDTLGVGLGNGMYNVQRSLMATGKARYTKFEGSVGAPKVIAELRVTYVGGATEVIGTDEVWEVAKGPVVFSSTYGGEDYDGRLAVPKRWVNARVVDGPGGVLTKAIAPEVVVTGVHEAVKVTPVGEGKTVYDLGENFAGVVDVKVRGEAGAVLRLTPGELLKGDGTVSQVSSGSPMWWSYTLRGDAGGEEWTPKFGYYGFRYVMAEWVSAEAGEKVIAPGLKPAAWQIEEPKVGKVVGLTGVAWSSGSKVVGSFESSSAMLNSIHQLIVNAMHNNEASVFTDCPHREKLGWMEETHLVAAGLMFNNDVAALYRATDKNIADAQKADGMVPTTAPQFTQFGAKYSVFDDSPEWGSASVLAPWQAYKFYGDKGELARQYGVMAGYVKYLEGKAVDGVVAYGLGDWYDIGPKPPGFSQDTSLGVTGTLMLYEDAVAMSRVAGVLGKADDMRGYEALAERTKAAFEKRFWDEGKGWYDRGSQTANAMPLALGIVPSERKKQVLERVIADIHAHGDHVTAGEVGYPYLLRALMEAGRDDVILAMMLRKDAPSYGSQVEAGATALTEAWDANPKSSQDHFMLGAGEEWFYRGLGGVDLDMSRVDAERITVRPKFVNGVDWVKVGYAAKVGKVESDWKRVGGGVRVGVTVPVEAAVELPVGAKVVRGGVSSSRVSGGLVSYRVRAGSYEFLVNGK